MQTAGEIGKGEVVGNNLRPQRIIAGTAQLFNEEMAAGKVKVGAIVVIRVEYEYTQQGSVAGNGKPSFGIKAHFLAANYGYDEKFSESCPECCMLSK